MGDKPKETAGNNTMKRKRKNKVDRIVVEPHWLDVEDENIDYEATQSDEDVNIEATEPDASDKEDSLFHSSHNSGSPQREMSEKSDATVESNFEDRLEKLAEESRRDKILEEEKNQVLGEMKATENDIVAFASGNSNEEYYVYQVFDIDYINSAKCYRSVASDGIKSVNKIVFNSSLNSKVEENLLNKKNVIKIHKYRIFNNSMVVIDDFDPYWKADNQVLGEPVELTENEYENVFKNKDNRYASSPGHLDKKLTIRKPSQLSQKKRGNGNT